MTTWNTCLVENCEKRAKTAGAKFCSACYERRRLYGRADYITERHGMWNIPEYAIWRDMRYRCTDPNHHAYKNYGGRGIDISPLWIKSFQCFISEMGRRPSPKHQIERIDNSLGYYPGNCKWATAKEQSRNRRSTKLNSEAIKVIKHLYTTRQKSQMQLAYAYMVHNSLISHICSGRRWEG